MKIKSAEIISFGKFKNKTIAFSDGLNIIKGDNESGKSTVISFIYTMFYGFGDNRGKGISIREKFTPWDGGECEGKLNIITNDNVPVTIYRKAGSVKKYDILKIYNTETAESLSLNPEDIVGIGSDTFLKTLCIKQLSSAFEGSSSEIITKLANISHSGDESTSYEKAMKILDNIRREIKPQRGNGGTLSTVAAEISGLERLSAEQKDIKAKFDRLTVLLPIQQKTAEKADEEYEKALSENFDANISNILGRISEIEVLMAEKENKTSFKKLFFVASFIFAVLGILILILKIKLWYLPLAASLLTCVCGFTAKNNNDTSQEKARLDSLRKDLESFNEKKSLHEKNVLSLKERLLSARNSLDNIKMQITSLKSMIKKEDTSSLPLLYQKRDMLERNYSDLTLVSKALESSHTKMQKNFTPAVNKKAAEYFSLLTDGKYTKLFCDEDFNLSIEADMPRESSFFSGGTVDQLYLSLRLALIDMLFKDNKTVIILDQPFLQYDTSRKENARKLLASLTEKRQILLFVANESGFSDNINTEILT